ncbi:glycoside hydrolase family 3 protein [Salinispira pacifica]|uniref:beta-N-acetylhexosaminidase n=1 Tax=Salinispira pacifica TaxID=1307761 RepID=V5WCI0_9SPIO|nr:glycoside hydrolase family 3 protein [Salinispira pacifica]AHC13487.1 Beta-hexosaminidase [Salinispira pacifica]
MKALRSLTKLLGVSLLIVALYAALINSSCGGRAAEENRTDSPTEGGESAFPAYSDPAWRILSEMSLDEKIGQLLLVQLRYDTRGQGLLELGEAEKALLGDLAPGGVILFRENMDETEQLVNLNRGIIQHSSYPPFIAADEEGGLVRRLPRSGKIPVTPVPSAEEIARHGTEHLRRLYGILARELRVLGFNMNFAPVADIQSDPDNELVATRSFGTTPEEVIPYIRSAVEALQEQGVISVLKHFPGHGESSGDSHYEVISLPFNLDRLREVELKPFQAGILAGALGIMTAHLYFPEIEPRNIPASLSPVFNRDLLRQEMGFNGIIITDALEMQGLRAVDSPEEAGVMAIEAGSDMLLIPPSPYAQRDAIRTAVIRREISPRRLDEAVHRIISVKITQGIWYNQDMPDLQKARNLLGREGEPQN